MGGAGADAKPGGGSEPAPHGAHSVNDYVQHVAGSIFLVLQTHEVAAPPSLIERVERAIHRALFANCSSHLFVFGVVVALQQLLGVDRYKFTDKMSSVRL